MGSGEEKGGKAPASVTTMSLESWEKRPARNSGTSLPLIEGNTEKGTPIK